MKATWNGEVLAQSDETILLEGNHYFPRASVNLRFLAESNMHSTCPWKGVASYYSVIVDGKRNENAAWYYPSPSAAAGNIKDHISFWRGVEVS